jgi:threonine/homoserine/homoserine lactone efflux protein
MVSLGASIADFAYVFIAVFGLTRLYSFYKPAMPYIFAVGSIFFFFLGYKIIRTKIDIEHLEDKSHLAEKIQRKAKGGFYTGFMINFLNPTLFLGVLTSSFFVITLIASLGFNTGGLAGKMNQNVEQIGTIAGKSIENPQPKLIPQFKNTENGKTKLQTKDPTEYTSSFHLLISVCYALFLSLGSMLWFFLLIFLIARYRRRISIKIISAFIRGLGLMLCLFGLYFGYRALDMLF